jgi:hypothetical protein
LLGNQEESQEEHVKRSKISDSPLCHSGEVKIKEVPKYRHDLSHREQLGRKPRGAGAHQLVLLVVEQE